MTCLSALNDGAEIYYLCSGFYYDNNTKTYIREDQTIHNTKVFSVVNSPVYAPMRSPGDNFSEIVHDTSLVSVIRSFLIEHGSFDVIHFQTLEGLSLEVLTLKKEFPQTKFILSIHNYTSVCPNVMLWTENNTNCEDSALNDKCHICMNRYNRPNTYLLKSFRKLLENEHDRLYYYTRGLKFLSRTYLPVRETSQSSVYKQYVDKSVQYINNYIDVVLAVSRRVRDIAVRRGVDAEKVCVSYIGTKFADTAANKGQTEPDKDPFSIVYMGYMRIEKGFYFLLDALDALDSDIAQNMSVTLATRLVGYKVRGRIKDLRKKYAEVKIFNGYTHSDIPAILNDVHLGIVPVLWEDNLPQVAIEMIANGVPVLASNLGGASELNDCPAFKFKGNNAADFLDKLIAIYSNRGLLLDYWKYARKLTTMEDHINQLFDVYTRG